MELLEEVYTRPDSSSPSMSFVFRKVLEEGNDEAVDKRKSRFTRLSLCGRFHQALRSNLSRLEPPRRQLHEGNKDGKKNQTKAFPLTDEQADKCDSCVAVSAMAERLANHFACYRPASDLFLQLLDMDKIEDAKFMLAVSTR